MNEKNMYRGTPGQFFSVLLVIFKPVILFGILGSYLLPSYMGKYFMKIGKISAKIHEIGKIKAIFGLGMTPI